MSLHLWLRAEENHQEIRTPLTPEDAHCLIEAGVRISVEKSPRRVFADAQYVKAGATLVPAGSWPSAPAGAMILGLKELPKGTAPLTHTHIFFAHVFKGQPDAESLLKRFADGGGRLLDLEYLVDKKGERLVAMGYWAGFIGAALGTWAWALGRRQAKPMEPLEPFGSPRRLVQKAGRQLSGALQIGGTFPRVLIVGAWGRSGAGAVDFLQELGVPVTRWGRHETEGLEASARILGFDIVVNCVENREERRPLLTLEALEHPHRRLATVSDVTCDVGNPCNLFPLTSTGTSLKEPVRRIVDGEKPVDFIAIDRLPTLLPADASRDFSAQLLPLLLGMGAETEGVWERAEAVFADQLRTRMTTPAAASSVNAMLLRSAFSPKK